MGIYLGQLPPAEIARLKAELAETLIANFCYPRFFDYRTDSLRMRPIDRAKRQEVWMYLSSVDFTTWSRVDLTSPDFQRQVERLFIQFVQRNRSFFGEQGRKRMDDIRMLIGSSASTVVQGLRAHLTGQRKGSAPFGSPRSVLSWSSNSVNGRSELDWERIASATKLLQQQLQEVRGEMKSTAANEERPTDGAARRITRTQPAGSLPGNNEQNTSLVQPNPPPVSKPTPQLRAHTTNTGPLSSSKSASPLSPVAIKAAAPVVPSTPVHRADPGVAPVEQSTPGSVRTTTTRNSGTAPVEQPVPKPTLVAENRVLPPPSERAQSSVSSTPSAPVSSRSLPQPVPPQQSVAVPTSTPNPRDSAPLSAGEEDIAIFEQLRQQLVVWIRVEAVRLSLDITDQSPSQLLEHLRQRKHFDETRLQVVSTLLNLSNQVIKNGQVSVLDYKQALMFHLMHTRP